MYWVIRHMLSYNKRAIVRQSWCCDTKGLPEVNALLSDVIS